VAQPSWLAYWFASLMVAVSVYCILRLALARRLGRRNQTDVTVAHVLMGFAMVGMLVPRWNVLPDGLWQAVFAVLAVYFAFRALSSLRRGEAGLRRRARHHLTHHLVHAVMSCAMLYMYWLGMPVVAPARAGAEMAMGRAPSGAGDPSLTLLIVGVLVVSALWQLDTMSRFRDPQLALASLGGSAPPEVEAGQAARTGPGGADRPAGGPGDGRPVGWPGVCSEPKDGDRSQPWLAPRLEIGCHVVMALTMAYMLVLMT